MNAHQKRQASLTLRNKTHVLGDLIETLKCLSNMAPSPITKNDLNQAVFYLKAAKEIVKSWDARFMLESLREGEPEK